MSIELKKHACEFPKFDRYSQGKRRLKKLSKYPEILHRFCLQES